MTIKTCDTHKADDHLKPPTLDFVHEWMTDRLADKDFDSIHAWGDIAWGYYRMARDTRSVHSAEWLDVIDHMRKVEDRFRSGGFVR